MRYGILDSAGVLLSYLEASRDEVAAMNTPSGGSYVRTQETAAPGTVKYDKTTGMFSAVLMASAVKTDAQVLAEMLDTIDNEREDRMMVLLTLGGAKKYEYANKAREVRDYRQLSGTVVANLLIPLNINGTRERFAWAMAEVDETGDSLETVITRWETAMAQTNLVRKLAARAQKIKRAIRAAAPSARKAIFDARAWPTS